MPFNRTWGNGLKTVFRGDRYRSFIQSHLLCDVGGVEIDRVLDDAAVHFGVEVLEVGYLGLPSPQLLAGKCARRSKLTEVSGPGRAPEIELGHSQGVRGDRTPPKPPSCFNADFPGAGPQGPTPVLCIGISAGQEVPAEIGADLH
jgi:hypothetical protein